VSNELAIEAYARVRARAFFVGDGRLTNRRKQSRLLPEHSSEERCKGEEAVSESMGSLLCCAEPSEGKQCRSFVGFRLA
jgi:hypothetical protein